MVYGGCVGVRAELTEFAAMARAKVEDAEERRAEGLAKEEVDERVQQGVE